MCILALLLHRSGNAEDSFSMAFRGSCLGTHLSASVTGIEIVSNFDVCAELLAELRQVR